MAQKHLGRRVNGGSTVTLSAGKLAIFCSSSHPLSFLQLTHLWTTLEISLLPPTTQSPAVRTAPSVLNVPQDNSAICVEPDFM